MSEQIDLVGEAMKIASPYVRHLGIFNPHRHQISASVIGCGAIGSFVAVGLAKMGVKNQVLFDMDTVEQENLPVQLHMRSGIGKNKAKQTAWMISEMCPEDTDIVCHEKWEGQPLKTSVVVSAVDDLEVRKAIWQEVKYDPTVKILVDARIGGTMAKVYAVSPTSEKDIKLYDATFPKNDMRGSDLPCTQRGVLDVSMFTASILINQIRRFIVSNEKETYLAFNLQGPLKSIMG
jgi:molybdopterin/thiamine biosynthesis adenylyltransferase